MYSAEPRRTSLGGNLSRMPQIGKARGTAVLALRTTCSVLAGAGLPVVTDSDLAEGDKQTSRATASSTSRAPQLACSDSVADRCLSPPRGRGLRRSPGYRPARPPSSPPSRSALTGMASTLDGRAGRVSPLAARDSARDSTRDSTRIAAATAPWPRESRGPSEVARGRLGVVVLPRPRPRPPRETLARNP